MFSEATVSFDFAGRQTLRYTRKEVNVLKQGSGYSCIVGDKIVRIFPSNRVEISTLEFLRDDELDTVERGEGEVAFVESLSWITQYPEELSLQQVKASLDFAFMAAGLHSIFYLTSLHLMRFETPEEEREAFSRAYAALYPDAIPYITELNATLKTYHDDLFLITRLGGL